MTISGFVQPPPHWPAEHERPSSHGIRAPVVVQPGSASLGTHARNAAPSAPQVEDHAGPQLVVQTQSPQSLPHTAQSSPGSQVPLPQLGGIATHVAAAEHTDPVGHPPHASGGPEDESSEQPSRTMVTDASRASVRFVNGGVGSMAVPPDVGSDRMLRQIDEADPIATIARPLHPGAPNGGAHDMTKTSAVWIVVIAACASGRVAGSELPERGTDAVLPGDDGPPVDGRGGDGDDASAADAAVDAPPPPIDAPAPDPFAIAICTGPAMTATEASARIAPGGSEVDLSAASIVTRVRRCGRATGCGPWTATTAMPFEMCSTANCWRYPFASPMTGRLTLFTNAQIRFLSDPGPAHRLALAPSGMTMSVMDVHAGGANWAPFGRWDWVDAIRLDHYALTNHCLHAITRGTVGRDAPPSSFGTSDAWDEIQAAVTATF